MELFEIGKKICEPSGDNIQLDFDDGGLVLLVKFRSPSAKEKRAIKNGVASFKLAVIDGIIFFLSRFDTMQWMDAPYHRDLSHNLTGFVRPQNGLGYSLHILFVDAATGILLTNRVIGLSTEFSSTFFDAVAQQPKLENRAEYYSQVSAIHNKCSTAEIVNMAIASN